MRLLIVLLLALCTGGVVQSRSGAVLSATVPASRRVVPDAPALRLERPAVPLAEAPTAIREGRERSEEEGRHEEHLLPQSSSAALCIATASTTRRQRSVVDRSLDGGADAAPPWLRLRHLLI